MAHIGLVYHAYRGRTRQIAGLLMNEFKTLGHEVSLLEMHDRRTEDLSAFDACVIGAAIRHGKHKPDVREFMLAHQAQLKAQVSGFYSVSAKARWPERAADLNHRYLQQLLEELNWHPSAVSIFGARLPYASMSAWQRLFLRSYMRLTHGPLDGTAAEFSDWQQVRGFTAQIHRVLMAPGAGRRLH